VAAIEAMHRAEAKVFVRPGRQLRHLHPRLPYTFEALRNCELTVQVSTSSTAATSFTASER